VTTAAFLPERTTTAADPARARLLARIAFACLVGHVAMTLFSAYAFTTFLAGPPPAWLQSPTNQAILRIGWQFGGPTCVVLGALAGLLHCASRLGTRTALGLFAAAFSISLASELAGTGTGYPFGPYGYTSQLGWKFFGLVPFNIPTSWFYMLYCALAIVGRVATAEDRSPRSASATKWKWAVAAGFVLTAWDVSMDPAMVRTTHWLWHLPPAEGSTTLQRLFVSDAFYGMPLSNWLGWLLTGIVVARVMLALVPPSRWARDVSPSRFPLVLYAVNGVLPIAICIRHGLTWAWVLGTLAMAIPLALAVRARRAERSERHPTDAAAPVAMAGD
jgi:uncharacterized membrane protein